MSPRSSESQVLEDVARLRRDLDAQLGSLAGKQTAGRRPHLLVLSGLPGTGKSHFAAQLAERVPLVVVGSDRSRKALVSRPRYTRGEHARVFAACHRFIEELLSQGHSVVFDATNLTQGFRRPLWDLARRAGAGLTVVWFTAPVQLVRRRLDQRAVGLDPNDYSDADWLVYCWLRTGEEVVQGPHLVVDSSADISPVLDKVTRRIAGRSKDTD